MNFISSLFPIASPSYYQQESAEEFVESSVNLEELKEELDGRTLTEALHTAGVRLKEHFTELGLIKDGKLDIEAFKSRLLVRHSWSTPVLIGY